MYEFLEALWADWAGLMGGVMSVVFWGGAAVLAFANVPVPVHLSFIGAAAISMFIASYRVWKRSEDK